MKNKYDIHKEFCENIHETHLNKDHDYGSAYSKVRKEEGAVTFLVHAKEKICRLDALIHGETPRVEETIEDSLIDLAGYCIMELTERKWEKMHYEPIESER